MKRLILAIFSINIMFADVLPKTYYGKWILLDKPNKDEKCKEIFIESRIYKYVILSEVKYLRF